MINKGQILVLLILFSTFLKAIPEYEKLHIFDKKEKYISLTGDCNNSFLLNKKSRSIDKIIEGKVIQSYQLPERIAKPTKIKLFDSELYILENSGSEVAIFDLINEEYSYISKEKSNINFSKPVDFTIDKNRMLYVLDSDSEMIRKFDRTGLFLGEKKIKNPIAVEVGNNQNIYVLSGTSGNYTITNFDNRLLTATTIQLQINDSHREFINFYLDEFDNFILVDDETDSFAHFDLSGSQVWKIGISSKSEKKGNFYEPNSLYSYVDEGFIYYNFFDQYHNSIQVFKHKAEHSIPQIEIENIVQYKALNHLKLNFLDMVVVGKKTFYLNNDKPFLTKIEGSEKTKYFSKEDLKKNKVKIETPKSITSDGELLYIVDAGMNCVHIISLEGDYIESFGEKGKTDGKFHSPYDITIANDLIFVSELDLNKISTFSRKGIFQYSFTLDSIQKINEISTAENGNLLILGDNKRVLEVNPKGELVFIEIFTEIVNHLSRGWGNEIYIFNKNKQNLTVLTPKTSSISIGSKGEKESRSDYENISRIYFDPFKEQIFLNEKSGITKRIQVIAKPKTISNLCLKINPNEKAILCWDDNKNNANYHLLRKNKESEWIVIDSTKANNYELNKASDKYQYAVVEKSYFGLKSDISEIITDDFSYAKQLQENGDLIEASKFYENYLEQNRELISTILQNIYRSAQQNFFKMKDFEKALYCVEKQIAITSDKSSLIKDKIKYLRLLKMYNEAISFVQESTDLDDDSKKLELMKLHYNTKNYNKVVDYASLILKENSANKSALNYSARSYKELKNYPKAEEIYKQLVIDNRENDILELVKILQVQNKDEEALTYIAKLITTDIDNPEYNYLYAISLFNTKKFSDAERYAEKAILKNDSNTDYFEIYGKALRNNNKVNESVKAYNSGLAIDSTSVSLAFLQAQNYRLLKDYNNAIHLLESVINYLPNNATSIQFHLEYANLLMKKTRFDSAVKEYEIALGLFPESAEVKKDLEKARKARIEFNKKRTPLELAKVEIPTLFPSLKNYYETHPIGNLYIFNTKEIPVTNISITIESDSIFTIPFTTNFPSVLANETETIRVQPKFNENLVLSSLEKSQEYPIKITLKYSYNDKEKTEIFEHKLKTYQFNAISWDDKKQIATFVNPENQILRDFAIQNINNNLQSKGYDPYISKVVQNAITAFHLIGKSNVRYISDPNVATKDNQIDFIQPALKTISTKGGDCDDLVVLYANLLETIGITTGYIDVPGHVIFTFDSEMTESELVNKGFSPEMFIQFNSKNLIPVEATLLGKTNFVTSWKNASQRYLGLISEGKLPEVIIFNKAHQQYKPLKTELNSLPTDLTIDGEELLILAEKDIKEIRKMTEKSTEELLTLAIQKYPNNTIIKNRFASYYIEQKLYKEAKVYLDNILKIDENNLIALNNLGNIMQLENNLAEAEKLYLKAIGLSVKVDTELYINMIKLALKQNDKKKAKTYFYKISDKKYLKKNYPKLIMKVI